MNCKSRRETGRRRMKFLPEEDEKLKELVEKYGKSWHEISNEMPGRNVRQCRERWKHYLSSDRAKSPWTNEEDLLLFQKFMELGPKWTKIAKCFDDRTDIQIKTRWIKRFGNCSPMFIPPNIQAIPTANEKVHFVPSKPEIHHPAKIDLPTPIHSSHVTPMFSSSLKSPSPSIPPPAPIAKVPIAPASDVIVQPHSDTPHFIEDNSMDSLQHKPFQFPFDDIFGEIGNNNFDDLDFSGELKDMYSFNDL